MVMAYLFLKAQGLTGNEVSSVSIDARNSAVVASKNCKISKLKKNGADLTFELFGKCSSLSIGFYPETWLGK